MCGTPVAPTSSFVPNDSTESACGAEARTSAFCWIALVAHGSAPPQSHPRLGASVPAFALISAAASEEKLISRETMVAPTGRIPSDLSESAFTHPKNATNTRSIAVVAAAA